MRYIGTVTKKMIGAGSLIFCPGFHDYTQQNLLIAYYFITALFINSVHTCTYLLYLFKFKNE